MTEAEWRVATDPAPMIAFLRRKSSGRKRRLFAVACCRRIWHLFAEEGFRQTVLAVERCADEVQPNWTACRMPAITAARRLRRDGVTTVPLEYYAALGSACAQPQEAAIESAKQAATSLALRLADESRPTRDSEWTVLKNAVQSKEREAQTELLRCIFGNPVQPIALDSFWRTPTVAVLAEAIYTERSFDRLPILADALEEAGCTDAAILEHCRGPGPHVRGCWVVDLILGKE
jgi:hypothetical protein